MDFRVELKTVQTLLNPGYGRNELMKEVILS